MFNGPAFDAFAGGLGVAAAVLLVGGSMLLRWQRNRQQFELMRVSIEKGLSPTTGGPPFWLLSLRQGLATLALGVGLLVVGAIGYMSSSGAKMPTPSTQPVVVQMAGRTMDGPPGGGRPMDRRGSEGPDNGPGPGMGPGEERGFDNGGRPPRLNDGRPPRGRGDFDGPEGPERDGPRGHMPDPAMDEWHRLRAINTISLMALAAGLILTLLGIVRTSFARLERQHTQADETTST